MHQAVAQQSFPDLGSYQVWESPVPSQGALVADLQSCVVLATPITPSIGGGDRTLSCKLACRAGKTLPSLCTWTMGGSDACDRGFDGLGPNSPGSIGPSRLLEPKRWA